MSDKWIERLVPWPVASIFVLISIALFSLIAGLRYSNGMCIWGLVAGIATAFGWFLLNADITKWKQYEENDGLWICRYLSFFGGPGALVWLLFTSTFVASEENKKIWIVNDRTTMSHSAIWAVPFYHNIQSVHTKLTTEEHVSAKTSDDVKLTVRTWTNIQLEPDDPLLLATAQEHVDAELALQTELNKLLADRLSIFIKQSTMQELQEKFSEDRVWLETEDVEKIKTSSGATWSGSSKITELALELK